MAGGIADDGAGGCAWGEVVVSRVAAGRAEACCFLDLKRNDMAKGIA